MFHRFIMARTAFLLFILFFSGGSQHSYAQVSERAAFYIPALRFDGATELGIALSNPTLNPVKVVLTARGDNGQILSGDSIQNPVELTVAAQGQVARVATAIFGPGIVGLNGSVEMIADDDALRGLFILSGMSTSDGGPIASTPRGRIVFPGVNGQTSLHVMNTGATPLNYVAVSVFSSAGTLAGKRTLALPGYGSLRGSIAELVPQAAGVDGYAIVDTQGNAFAGRPNVLVGMASTTRGGDAAIITARAEEQRTRAGFVPHVAIGAGFSTRLKLVNTHVAAQRVKLTLSGTAGLTAELTSEQTIPPFGQLDEDLGRIFNVSADTARSGFLAVETLTATPGVDGHVEISTTDNSLLTAVPISSEASTELVFPWLVEGGTSYTGIALFNPSPDLPSAVSVEAYGDGKTVAASIGFTLQAREHRAVLLRDLLPNFQVQQGGYLRIVGTPGIHALQLLVPSGPGGPGGALVHIPATRFLLNEQATGAIVDSSEGAVVVSEDQETSLIVPPGVMTNDGRVTITSIDVANLPPATDNQSPLAALEALAGARFEAPVRFRVTLNEPANPGTKMEVWLLNPDTNRYERTEFVATVDDDGRTAWADVTHFTTFVLRSADRPVRLDVSPESGAVGNTIRIRGHAAGTIQKVSFPGPRGTSIRARIISERDNQLEVEIPNGTETGRVRVIVEARAPGGARTTAHFTFTVDELDNPLPRLDSIDPASVRVGDTVSQIQVQGSDFVVGAAILLDGRRLPTIRVDSSVLRASIPESTLDAGYHRVQVSNPAPGGGLSRALELEVLHRSPRIISISPRTVRENLATTVTITGSNFTSNTEVEFVGNGTIDTVRLVDSGTLAVSLRASASGVLRVSGPDPIESPGYAEASLEALPERPDINSFTAAPTAVPSGQSSTLSWTTSNADECSIDNGVGTVSCNGSTNVTPAATTTYRLTATNDGGSRSSTTTVTVTAGLTADNDNYSTNEDTMLTVAAPGVLDGDSGGTLTAQLVSNVSNGALSLSTDGSFTYQPNANFNGTDSFTYRANDGSNNSNTATVTITVNAVNDAPVADNDNYSTNEDTTLNVAAPGVIDGDTDTEVSSLSASLVLNVSNGTLTFNANGSFSYTPAANFNGTDTFTYRVSDGTANSNTATVTITVNAVNDAPVAVSDNYSMNEDGPDLAISAPGVLANDTDVESNPLTAVLVQNVSSGVLTLNSNGSFTYEPNDNFNGTDSFTYRANDGSNSNTATVTITVNSVDDTVTYEYDNDSPTYSFVVPVGVTSLKVDAFGASGGQGSNNTNPVGKGGRVRAELVVTPGETITIVVGSAGGNSINTTGGAGGDNGGGAGADGIRGGGGGASDVRQGGTGLADRVIVAAGGGGNGGAASGGSQGHGGGTTGQAGGNGSGAGGGAGTPSAAGAGGSAALTVAGSNGNQENGGAGGRDAMDLLDGGGGGGGGYYGGGGGSSSSSPDFGAGAGGGGSSVARGTASNVTHEAGANTGNGRVILVW